jgi:hypothetical protein
MKTEYKIWIQIECHPEDREPFNCDSEGVADPHGEHTEHTVYMNDLEAVDRVIQAALHQARAERYFPAEPMKHLARDVHRSILSLLSALKARAHAEPLDAARHALLRAIRAQTEALTAMTTFNELAASANADNTHDSPRGRD